MLYNTYKFRMCLSEKQSAFMQLINSVQYQENISTWPTKIWDNRI